MPQGSDLVQVKVKRIVNGGPRDIMLSWVHSAIMNVVGGSDSGDRRRCLEGEWRRWREAAGHGFFQVRKRFCSNRHESGTSICLILIRLGVLREQDPPVYHHNTWAHAFPLLPGLGRLQKASG